MIDQLYPIREAAIGYVANGVIIAPLKPRSKCFSLIYDLRKPITTIEDAIYYWDLYPVANVAAPTSKKYNDWIVVDIDVKNGINGVISIFEIIESNGLKLPETCVVKSGSGGYHCYYRNVKNLVVPSSNGKQLGIDIRAESAYVVLPPSVHHNGNQYQWIIGDVQSISDANDDVYQLVDIVNRINNAKHR